MSFLQRIRSTEDDCAFYLSFRHVHIIPHKRDCVKSDNYFLALIVIFHGIVVILFVCFVKMCNCCQKQAYCLYISYVFHMNYRSIHSPILFWGKFNKIPIEVAHQNPCPFVNAQERYECHKMATRFVEWHLKETWR